MMRTFRMGITYQSPETKSLKTNRLRGLNPSCYSRSMLDTSESLICQSCKVSAHARYVDGDLTDIRCPSCGVFLSDDDAREVLRQQLRYVALKKARAVFAGGLRSNKTIKFSAPKTNDPGGPFIIGKPDS